MKRRQFLFAGSGALAITGGLSHWWPTRRASAAAEAKYEINRTEAEWREILSPARYAVLREEDTERAFSSPLNDEKRAGTFHCAGCDQAAYSSDTKYDSGTGWPSFWESLPDAVGTKVDRSFFMTRTECHCSRCGGHFGHIFDDGPPPTGKRHCINGLALNFKAAQA